MPRRRNASLGTMNTPRSSHTKKVFRLQARVMREKKMGSSELAVSSSQTCGASSTKQPARKRSAHKTRQPHRRMRCNLQAMGTSINFAQSPQHCDSAASLEPYISNVALQRQDDVLMHKGLTRGPIPCSYSLASTSVVGKLLMESNQANLPPALMERLQLLYSTEEIWHMEDEEMCWMNNFQFHRTIKQVLLPLWHALLNETHMRQNLGSSTPNAADLHKSPGTEVSREVYQELYKCLIQLLLGETTTQEAQRMAEVHCEKFCQCLQLCY